MIIGVVTSPVFAQPGYVDLKNGDRIEGIIDLINLEPHGEITISPIRGEYTFSAEDLTNFFVYKEGHFVSKPVHFLNNDAKSDTVNVILKPITETQLVLYRAYGMNFEFVLNTNDSYQALQSLNGNAEEELNEEDSSYKTILGNAFSDCNDPLITDTFVLDEDHLIQALKGFDDCSDWESKSNNKLKISLDAGMHASTLNFLIASEHQLDKGTIYAVDYESLQEYFGIGIHRSDLFKNIDFGAALEYSTFNFEPILTDSVIKGDDFDYSELRTKFSLEPNVSFGKFTTSLRTGVNVNITLRNYSKEVPVDVLRKSGRNGRVLTMYPKLERDIRTSVYINFFAAPTLSYQISESMNLGVSYYFITNTKERISAENPGTDDTLKNSMLGFRLIYQL